MTQLTFPTIVYRHIISLAYKQQNIPENDVMALDATGLLAFDAHPQLSSSLPENMGQ